MHTMHCSAGMLLSTQCLLTANLSREWYPRPLQGLLQMLVHTFPKHIKRLDGKIWCGLRLTLGLRFGFGLGLGSRVLCMANCSHPPLYFRGINGPHLLPSCLLSSIPKSAADGCRDIMGQVSIWSLSETA